MARSKYEYVNAGNWVFLTFLRIWARINAFFFFRRYAVRGVRNIPRDQSVIFAVNHQSAFLDPVLVGISCGRKPWYLTRAGVFVNPVIRYILRAIHMLPVYRNRDNVNLRKANDPTFRQCRDILRENGSLLIFPEGNHGMMKTLRTPLRKGMARIALKTLTAPEPPADVLIVPVGINYEHPTRFRTDVLIRYGAPLSAASYQEAYRENPAEAMNRLMQAVGEAMSAEMIDIQPPDRYDELEARWMAARSRDRNLDKRFREDRLMLSTGDFSGGQSRKSISRWLVGIAGFPFFLSGVLLNLPLYLVSCLMIRLTVRDPHFLQSVKFVLGMTLVPLYAIVAGLFLGWLTQWHAWYWIPVIPLSGIAAYDYADFVFRNKSYPGTRQLMGNYVPSH